MRLLLKALLVLALTVAAQVAIEVTATVTSYPFELADRDLDASAEALAAHAELRFAHTTPVCRWIVIDLLGVPIRLTTG